EPRAAAAALAADRVTLHTSLRREQLLARLRVAGLVAVLGGEDEREDVRDFERRESRPLDPRLAHLRAHERQVVPHRRAQLVEAGAARNTRQVRSFPSFAGAANPVTLPASLLRVHVPSGDQRPVGRERERGLLGRRLLRSGRRERGQEEKAHSGHAEGPPAPLAHSNDLLWSGDPKIGDSRRWVKNSRRTLA